MFEVIREEGLDYLLRAVFRRGRGGCYGNEDERKDAGSHGEILDAPRSQRAFFLRGLEAATRSAFASHRANSSVSSSTSSGTSK